MQRAYIIIGAFPLTDKPSPKGGDCEEDAIDNEDWVDKERPSSFGLTLKLKK